MSYGVGLTEYPVTVEVLLRPINVYERTEETGVHRREVTRFEVRTEMRETRDRGMRYMKRKSLNESVYYY